MKKMNTIHLLPEFTSDMTSAERDARFMENWEMAATIDFIPDSLETLRAIDYTELIMLMNQNEYAWNQIHLGSDYRSKRSSLGANQYHRCGCQRGKDPLCTSEIAGMGGQPRAVLVPDRYDQWRTENSG